MIGHILWLGGGAVLCLCCLYIGWVLAHYYQDNPPRSAHTAPYSSAKAPLHQMALDELVELIPGMALILDPMGQILACNQAAQEHYKESLRAILRHPNSRAILHEALATSPSTGPHAIHTAIVHLDVPIKHTIRLAMRQLSRPQGRDKMVLTLLTDHSTEQAMDRMRADFIAHASHELRTPLASLSGFIDLLKDNEGTTDQASRTLYLQIMSQQATRMQRLVERLLYLSHLQLRSHSRPHTRLDVGELFALIVGEVLPRFTDNTRNLTVEQEEDHLTLLADEDEMIQLFLNLIENAIRYGTTPDHALQVRLCARREGTGILLSVSDNGPGIAPHHLPRLTERFYRVTDNKQTNPAEVEEGTGLGLAIVQQIVERHKGHLRFLSPPHEGTICRIWLPAAPAL